MSPTEHEVAVLKGMTESMAIKLALLQLGLDKLEELAGVALHQWERNQRDGLRLTLVAIRDQARKALAV